MIIENVKILKADEGMRLTDGNIYAKTVFLPEGRTADEFIEITEEAYEEIMKEQEAENEPYREIYS